MDAHASTPAPTRRKALNNMKTIIVKTQAEIDALPASFSEFTYVEIRGGTPSDPLCIRTAYGSSTVRAYDSSTVTAYGSSTVTACNSSTVRAYDSSTVTACNSSTVRAYDSSTVRAYDSSTVRACGSSTVTACGSSTVTAYDSSTVTACNSSTVRAYDSSCVHNHSTSTGLELLGCAVAILVRITKKLKRGKLATVVKPKAAIGATGWLSNHGIRPVRGFAVLYKRVSKAMLTQEGTPNETKWAVGSTLEHPAWSPKDEECGAGKFHACPAPFFCDTYRDSRGDVYVAIKVAVRDMYAWPEPQHPHKIAFRKGTVLHVCDINGKALESKKGTT
jgi:hypothetical protein